jgi:hypothetical protein
MGESVNLSLVLTILAALFDFVPKLSILGQMVVASLSTILIAVAFWKASHYLSAKHMKTCNQMQQDVFCPTFSSLVTLGVYPLEE